MCQTQAIKTALNFKDITYAIFFQELEHSWNKITVSSRSIQWFQILLKCVEVSKEYIRIFI